jgi:hypothetical protein
MYSDQLHVVLSFEERVLVGADCHIGNPEQHHHRLQSRQVDRLGEGRSSEDWIIRHDLTDQRHV